MKRKMADTSLQVYENEVIPNLSKKQKEVYDALIALGGKATNQEIANHLKIGIHKVAPRTGELMLMGKIKRGKRLERAYQLEVVTKDVQLNLELSAV